MAVDRRKRMTSYSAEPIDKIENTPGCWNSIKVAVFRRDGDRKEQVGEYVRNYPNLFRTFWHFRKGEMDYALYSPDYTASRIMELPSCKDIGGEEPYEAGFCPTDYYVPSYIDREYLDVNDKPHWHRVTDPSPEDLVAQKITFTPLDEKTGQRIKVEKSSYPVSPLLYYPFGFVAGCIWGDDSSWKIQFFDLANAEGGILKRDERFGYIALPSSLSLKQAIEMIDFNDEGKEEWAHHITIAVQKRFDLRTRNSLEERDW
jgi:hypothetical protein